MPYIEDKTPMPIIPVKWATFTAISDIKKEETALTFTLTDGKTAVTMHVAFPAVGGVRIFDREGFFKSEPLPITYGEDGKMTAGNTAAVFTPDEKDLFTLSLLDGAGAPVVTLCGSTLALGYDEEGVCRKALYRFPFDSENDVLFGMGERFNCINQIGACAYLWNEDTVFGRDERDSYQNIPLLHNTAGYSVFINTMYGGWADFGGTEPNVTRIDFNTPDIDMFLFVGTPLSVLDSYTQLTGREVLPPKWAFRYWMGSSWYSWNKGDIPCTEKFRNILEGYKAIGISNLAACYAEGITNIPETFDIAKEYGIRLFHWNYPAVRFEDHDHLGKKDDMMMELCGSTDPALLPIIYTKGTDYEPSSGTMTDFTHPNAPLFVERYYRDMFKKGLAGAMIDFGDQVKVDGVFYNGKDGNVMHNESAYWYAKVMHDVFTAARGDDWVLFQRPGCAGSQHYASHFGGDQPCTYRGIQQAFYAGLNAAASGYSNWGSDIGGLGGVPSDELYVRWLQYSTFSPFMRAHSQSREKMREPWEFGDLAVEQFKKLYWWRENMLDYIYSAAIFNHKTGTPIMRAMPLVYPQEKAVAHTEDQYFFGSELLVAPVLIDRTTFKPVYFPKGNWTSLWSGDVTVGGRRLFVSAPLETIPVFLREGAILPLTLPKETLAPCENMETVEKVAALMVTPAVSRREVVHFASADDSFRLVSEKPDGGILHLENPDGMKVGALLIMGADVSHVAVDGKEVPIPKDGNKTTVRLANGFKTVTVF